MSDWKRIPGFPMYLAHRDGRIKSRHSGKVLKTSLNNYGYPMVNVCDDKGRERKVTVHSLIALAHLGPRPEGHIVHHQDYNRTNPHVDNLCYMCEFAHKSIDASERVGEKNMNAKLSNEDVVKIKLLLAHGIPNVEIAECFNIHPATVSQIKHGKRRLEE